MYNLRIFRLEALCKAKAVFAYILILLDALPVVLFAIKVCGMELSTFFMCNYKWLLVSALCLFMTCVCNKWGL